MKICQYCGTQNADDAARCTGCGGNAFRNLCSNCGTEFEGAFCPVCGVRAGDPGRICPRCKTRYFTNACPTCGFVPAQERGASEPAASAFPGKRSVGKTILWILGWLFCFPIPVTVLIARSSMKKWLKGVLIAAVWIFFIAAVNLAPEDPSVTAQSGKVACITEVTELPGQCCVL